jgi:hypothetical protein
MATFTGKWYGLAFQALANKEIDLVGTPDTLKMALTTSAYTPAQDTDNYFDDVTNELGAGSGYTSGGFTADNVTWGYTGGTNTWKLDCDDEVVASTTLTWRNLILYDSTPGTAGTNPLMIYQTGDGDTTTTGGTLTIQPHANGLGTLVVS